MTAILDDLTTACPTREATDADAVDGVPARFVAGPTSTEQVAALMAASARHDLAVVPRGSGTKLRWGMPPERVDIVLDMIGMAQVVEYAPGDLIAVLQAGVRLDDLAAPFGEHRQRLGIDPPRRGTVGGAVATGASGPTRLFHGGVRDVVIGATFVRADGVVAKAGGKVVKNVAGYDIGRLLAGSYGTLAVLTEVAVRLHPEPEAARWVSCALPGADQRAALLRRLTHTQTAPLAAELDLDPGGTGTLAVAVEGTPAGVDGRAQVLVGELGQGAAIADTPPAWWTTDPSADTLVKLTHTLSGGPALYAALAAADAATGLRSHLRDSVLVGVAHAGLSGDLTAESLGAWLDSVRSAADRFGGTAVLLEAPAGARDGIDVWGPVRGIPLMRAVKERFDPDRRLAPGRFVGGI